MTGIIAVTTFPNAAWDVYAKAMLQSFVQYWPSVPILVQLDDDMLKHDVSAIINRPSDAIAINRMKTHQDFVDRNKGKDHPDDYRKQVVRFCHKIFTLKRAADAVVQMRKAGESTSRYIIWLDADVITNRPVTLDEINECLPKDGAPVAYLGRRDWDHSECGWLAFDIESGGYEVINRVYDIYVSDQVLTFEQNHDSWVFDQVRSDNVWTNLTAAAAGRDVWDQSPMGKWSTHHKGPVNKAKLGGKTQPRMPGESNIRIQTRNAIPAEEIQAHIRKNQDLIKNWVRPCVATDEELVIASAGPMLVAEDIRKEIAAGKKVVAVKHALKPLKEAGVKPWACILLDPRGHVADFVQDADPDIIWFVASQVTPVATMELLAKGCKVWGYHAAVGAGEDHLTSKQPGAVIAGGSATATRGLFMLNQLGFSSFALYGYDLCVPDKPADKNAVDQFGQPKHFEMSVGIDDPLFSRKRLFFTEPQLMAQFEELREIIRSGKFKLRAHGDGMVPFMIRAKEISDMRRKELRDKLMGENPPTYDQLLG